MAEDSLFVMWHDPTKYDPLRHGPPYVPQVKDRLSGHIASGHEKEGDTSLVTFSQMIKSFSLEVGEAPYAELASLLAFLRAEAFLHQTYHWQTGGSSYFGDHQLYERLYDEVQDFIDRLGERVVGSGGTSLVHPLRQAGYVAMLVQVLHSDAPPDPTANELALLALRTVVRYQAVSKMVYAILEERGQLTHGIDNLLQEIADKHEEHAYLLKQRTKTASYDRRAKTNQRDET